MQTFVEIMQIFSSLVVAILLACLVFALIAISIFRKKKQATEEFSIINLNEYLNNDANVIQKNVLKEKDYKKWIKTQKANEEKFYEKDVPCVFVIEFQASVTAEPELKHLRRQINAILQTAKPNDTVVCILESGGGLVQAYGLAASQLMRLRNAGLHVIVCVDKIAASGGYMMACVAHTIIAAPFAIIGSIGVLAGIPNIHRFLKKHEIDYYELTAGEYKRTVSVLGEVTPEKIDKEKTRLESIHKQFQQHIANFRPQLDLQRVANGDYWCAQEALNLGLVDRIATSDDIIFEFIPSHKVFLLKVEEKKKWYEKFAKETKILHDIKNFLITKIGA